MLHACLELYAIHRVNLGLSPEQSYNDAMELSKSLGVMAEFCTMDRGVMESPLNDAVTVMTEVPFIVSKDLVVRCEAYTMVKNGDILVGTADLIVERKNGSFLVADWKTGLDDVDAPRENDQLIALGWMAARYFGIASLYLGLINPVTKQSEIEQIEITSFESQRFMDTEVKESAGDHCRYCHLKTNCESFANMSRQEVQYAGFQDPLADGE